MRDGLVVAPIEIHDGEGLTRIPLLKGEGGAKHRVRGKEKAILYPSPGPTSLDDPPSPFRRGIRPKLLSNLNSTAALDPLGLSTVSVRRPVLRPVVHHRAAEHRHRGPERAEVCRLQRESSYSRSRL
jgi:hypothetical protein